MEGGSAVWGEVGEGKNYRSPYWYFGSWFLMYSRISLLTSTPPDKFAVRQLMVKTGPAGNAHQPRRNVRKVHGNPLRIAWLRVFEEYIRVGCLKLYTTTEIAY